MSDCPQPCPLTQRCQKLRACLGWTQWIQPISELRPVVKFMSRVRLHQTRTGWVWSPGWRSGERSWTLPLLLPVSVAGSAPHGLLESCSNLCLAACSPGGGILLGGNGVGMCGLPLLCRPWLYGSFALQGCSERLQREPWGCWLLSMHALAATGASGGAEKRRKHKQESLTWQGRKC